MLKELITELQHFISTFIGFFGFILWAWVGRVVYRFHRSLTESERISAFIIFAELPIAMGMGIILGGLVEYFTEREIITEGGLMAPALVAAGSYLGPRVLGELWNKYTEKPKPTHIHINSTPAESYEILLKELDLIDAQYGDRKYREEIIASEDIDEETRQRYKEIDQRASELRQELQRELRRHGQQTIPRRDRTDIET